MLERLKENIGETISGALYDEMVKVLETDLPRPELDELLTEIEALDGEVRSQRSLVYYFQQHRDAFG